jgi:hypothetical protein
MMVVAFAVPPSFQVRPPPSWRREDLRLGLEFIWSRTNPDRKERHLDDRRFA